MTMMNVIRMAGAVLLLAGIAGCSSRPANDQDTISTGKAVMKTVFTEKIKPEYAEGFEIRR